MADTFAPDLAGVAEYARDGERLIVQREHTDQIVVDATHRDSPAATPLRRAHRIQTAFAEIQQRAFNAGFSELPNAAVHCPTFGDAIQVDAHAGTPYQGGVVEHERPHPIAVPCRG